jgi:hypothetical protein
MAKVGEAAQLYSGPSSASDLPYDYAATATDFSPTGYQNFPTLKAGTLDRFHVFINSSGPWKTGQISNNHWPSHSGTVQSFTHGTVCAASYADDQGGATGPITDIWLTQDNVPQFFRFVDLHPSISAHARVELQQGNAGDVIRPIAVRDSTTGGLPSCVTINFVRDDGTNTVIKTVTLTKDATGDVKFPSGVLWDNPAGDSLAMPSANVIVQPVLGCGAAAAVYDDTTNSGLLYINTYGTTTPAVGEAPRITTGGVSPTNGVLLTGTCNSDQYFSSTACVASVTADVAFAPNLPYLNTSVTAVDTSSGATLALSKLSTTTNSNPNGSIQIVPGNGHLQVASTAGFTNSGSISVNGVDYAYSGTNNNTFLGVAPGSAFPDNSVVTQTGDNRWTSGVAGFTIPLQDGRHPIRIDWTQTSGSVGGTLCTVATPCTNTSASSSRRSEPAASATRPTTRARSWRCGSAWRPTRRERPAATRSWPAPPRATSWSSSWYRGSGSTRRLPQRSRRCFGSEPRRTRRRGSSTVDRAVGRMPTRTPLPTVARLSVQLPARTRITALR